MIRVRIVETYNNWYWNSATGVTLRKDDRKGMIVDENDKMVRRALDQGILEIVSDEEFEKTKIMDTKMNTSNAIKEVVTPKNTEQIKRIKEDLTNATGNTHTSNKEDSF